MHPSHTSSKLPPTIPFDFMTLGIQKLQGLHHKLSKVPYNFDFHHNHMVYMVIYNDARIPVQKSSMEMA